MFRSIVLTAAVCIGWVNFAQTADLPMKDHYTFDNKNTLRQTRNSISRVLVDKSVRYNNMGTQKIIHQGNASSAYNGFRLPAAPGELQVRFNIKGMTDGKCTLILNYNKKNGRNGSAGSTRFAVPITSGWRNHQFYTVVPADVFSVQFIFTVSGKPNTVWLNDIYFGYAPDHAVFPFKKGDLKAPLTHRAWNPKQQLGALYQLDGRSTHSPTVQMAADSSGLYVAFKNPWEPTKKVHPASSRDKALWWDDCNEVFIFDPKINRGWHYIVNANGAITDALIYQRQDGDPWRNDLKWNSPGVKAIAVDKGSSWESKIFIPWKDLNLKPQEGLTLGINFSSENQAILESSSWDVSGKYLEVNRYAALTFQKNTFTISRDRKLPEISYVIKRDKPQFESLLIKGTPGKYIVNASSHGGYFTSFPEAVQKKAGKKGFELWQNELMKCWGEAGMCGMPFPWVPNNLINGAKTVKELHKKYSMKFPLGIHSSYQMRIAREQGAKFILPRPPYKVSSIDPVMRKVMIQYIRSLKKNKYFTLMQGKLSDIYSVDEPLNGCTEMYSKTLNKQAHAALDEVSSTIKKRFGFGKYGLTDEFGKLDDDTPFRRIAFYRWFNHEYLQANKEWRNEVRKLFPDTPYEIATNNTCGGMAPMDYSLFDGEADILAVDPYPTSATYQFGFARGLYHTGFTVKMLRDLAPNMTARATLQGFIYCGGKPEKDEMREWTSQALKNGADCIGWYCMDSPTNFFEGYLEVLALNKLVSKLDKVDLPKNPRTAILFSNYDQYALHDNSLHASYSVYSILGEYVKSNFCFVSPTLLARNIVKLDDFKLLYVPKLTYTDKALTARLKKFAANGGTIVVFDPRFLTWNIDGTSAEADRTELTGVKSVIPRSSAKELESSFGKLKLFANANVQLPTGMKVESYALNGVTSKVIATYANKTPAVVENRFGKGKVIYFASQPFGNSNAALEPGNWVKFFTALAQESGSGTDLPIWDFLIPAERLQRPVLKQLK